MKLIVFAWISGWYLISPVVFPGDSVVKNLPASTGDIGNAGSIPGSGRSPEKRSNTPLQYSCLGNIMDRGA